LHPSKNGSRQEVTGEHGSGHIPARSRARARYPDREPRLVLRPQARPGVVHSMAGVRLMGVSAARLHNVVPRALGIAIVAVAGDRRDIVLRDRDGLVHFVQRDTDVLDAELMTTNLGQCLVTTAEQTVLDLAHRPNLGHVVEEAHAAIVALLPRCNDEQLERLAGEQRLRAALTRVRRAARLAATPARTSMTGAMKEPQ